MNAKTLLDWEQKHNAIRTTIEGFWNCFRKWREEDKKDYHDTFQGNLYDDFISVSNRSIYLKYNFNQSEAFVFCSINIMYLDEEIGTYDIEFFLNGEISDEYLDFGDKRVREWRISELKHKLNTARKSLKEGLGVDIISKITGLDTKYIETLEKKYL